MSRTADLRNYVLVTAAYWADTIADGAIRLLVLFYFYERGYSPIEVASLFLFYEFFGIVTNLVGGWLAARMGLRFTLVGGLATQLVALGMLAAAPESLLVVPYVMAAQALSGIAKDLTKMSSKSAIKLVVPEGADSQLYRWVAILTGSKNALKGVGFFLGGLLLGLVGFQTAMLALAAMVALALLTTASLMHGGLGTTDATARFRHMFSNDRAVNLLAAARVFLFASRDVWFVVALPVLLLTQELVTDLCSIGTLFAFMLVSAGVLMMELHPESDGPRTFRVPYVSGRWLMPVIWGAYTAATVGTLPENHNIFAGLSIAKLPYLVFYAALTGMTVTSAVWSWSLIPVLGVLSNLYLIAGLGHHNWMRFLLWCAIGLTIYFTYGFWHSKLNRTRRDSA